MEDDVSLDQQAARCRQERPGGACPWIYEKGAVGP